MKNLLIRSLGLLAFCATLHAVEELPMLVVVPSYNNAQFYEKNLASIMNQQYKNFSVIYINDASTDKTGELVEQYVLQHGFSDRFTLVHNPTNKGVMYNIYHAVHGCANESIIVELDGDDWFDNDGVLARINKAYHEGEVWMTFGSYVDYPSGNHGFTAIFPEQVIKDNAFRAYAASPWVPIRTYYAWLFKHIKQEDLSWAGSFLPMAHDEARMYAMLEMAGERHRFIADVLYQYNRENPISDNKKDLKLQRKLARYVERQKPYVRLGDVDAY